MCDLSNMASVAIFRNVRYYKIVIRGKIHLTNMQIMACTVVQAAVKVYSERNANGHISTPCGSETPGQLDFHQILWTIAT